MYNINYKKYNKELIIGFILLIMGILFLSLYMNYVFDGALKKMFLDKEIESTFIDDNKIKTENGYLYSPVYTFIVNNKTYYCEVKNSSIVKPNKNKTLVYYDSNNPNNCVNEYEATPSVYSYVILFFPMFSIALGLFELALSIRDIRKLNRLEKTGTLIKNIVYKIEEIEIKKRKIIKVIGVEYKLDNGTTLHLISDLPNKNIEIIGFIDLLIDMNEISNFYLDFNIKKH